MENMDDENVRNIVPRDVLVKQGISAAACLAGGVFLLLMSVGSRVGLLGMVLSVASLVIGIGSLLSKDREDKKPGFIFTGAGLLGLLLRFGPAVLKSLAGTGLVLGAFGLFAAGIWKGIKFLMGLKSRQ